jgi:hypothetical protein
VFTVANRTKATGRIEVKTYVPAPYDSLEGGPTLVNIDVTETFIGDIEGEGTVRFLQAMQPDGSASFCGIERVKGRIGKRQGTFLLQDQGSLQGKTVTGTWFVIPGSGTGALKGLRGEGGFSADLGQNAAIHLDYWFEA